MPVPHVSPDRSRAGFSMLELLLALAVSTLVLLAVGMNFLDFSRAFSSIGKLMHSRARAQTIGDRLVDELLAAQASSLVPSTLSNSGSVEFRKITGTNSTDGSAIVGNPIHIDLIPLESNTTDLIDNDGDGLVDEGAIRIWEDLPPYGPSPVDNPVILTDKAANAGLKLTRTGSYLTIDMTLQEVFEIGIAPKTTNVLSGVMLRN